MGLTAVRKLSSPLGMFSLVYDFILDHGMFIYYYLVFQSFRTEALMNGTIVDGCVQVFFMGKTQR